MVKKTYFEGPKLTCVIDLTDDTKTDQTPVMTESKHQQAGDSLVLKNSRI
jgi:hypothetical protein